MPRSEALKNAIRFFERDFRCRLCLHDYSGMLPDGLLPSYHLNPFCTALKNARPQLHRICFAFDRFAVREYAEKNRSFLLKRCACGFLEGVFPIPGDGRIEGTLFAGPFTAAGLEEKDRPELLTAPVRYDMPGGRKAGQPPALPRDLGRFRAYGELIASQIALLAKDRTDAEPQGDRERVRAFLERQYSRPAAGLDDLAKLLGLTPSRASNRITRLFGKGPCALLREYRIAAARRLLEQSGFSAEEIARRCGFRDGSYFHRVFRQETGMSPMEYRREHRTENV